MHLLSPAQLVGYVTLVLGVVGFSQRDDRRLKLIVTCECAAYVLHFALLGRPPAAVSAAIAGARTLISIRFRSAWLAAACVAVNVALAAALGTHGTGWLVVVGSCLGAIAVLTMEGIPMRLVLLGATSLWLANNILSRSVGGTVLEALVATATLTTIGRMALAPGAPARTAVTKAQGAAL